jgi:hypothetical protein
MELFRLWGLIIETLHSAIIIATSQFLLYPIRIIDVCFYCSTYLPIFSCVGALSTLNYLMIHQTVF